MFRVRLHHVLAAIAAGVAVQSVAEAAPRAVVPVTGPSACRTRSPVLLTAGSSPQAPLRFDLASMAGTSETERDTEIADSKVRAPDGTWHPSARDTTAVTMKATTGRVSHGRLPTSAKGRVTGSSVPRPTTVTVEGSVDVLGGGSTGGRKDTDHFPREPVGIGATWRVVNCDSIDQFPAKETRVYTLRAVREGIAYLTFVDVISIDPAHADLGSHTEGGITTRYTLVTITGSATGSVQITFTRALREVARTVSKLRVGLLATAPSTPKTLIHLSVTDTERLLDSP
jgi:hypothetical protein